MKNVMHVKKTNCKNKTRNFLELQTRGDCDELATEKINSVRTTDCQ